MEKVHSGWLMKSPPDWKVGSTWRLFKSKWRHRYFVLYVPPSSAHCGQVGSYENWSVASGATCSGTSYGLTRISSGPTAGPQLCYYEDQQLDNQRGKIDLRQCDALLTGKECAEGKTDLPFMFALRMRVGSFDRTTASGNENKTSAFRTYYMSAGSEETMNEWIECLRDELRKYSPGDAHPGLMPWKPGTYPTLPIRHPVSTFSVAEQQQQQPQPIKKHAQSFIARRRSKSIDALTMLDCHSHHKPYQTSINPRVRSKSPGSPLNANVASIFDFKKRVKSRFRSSFMSLLSSSDQQSSAETQRLQPMRQSRRPSLTQSEFDCTEEIGEEDDECRPPVILIHRRPSDFLAEAGSLFRTNPRREPKPSPPTPNENNWSVTGGGGSCDRRRQNPLPDAVSWTSGCRTPSWFPRRIQEMFAVSENPSASCSNFGRRLPPLPSTGAAEDWASNTDDETSACEDFDSEIEFPESRPVMMTRQMSRNGADACSLGSLKRHSSEETFDLPDDEDEEWSYRSGPEANATDQFYDVNSIYDVPRRLVGLIEPGNHVDDKPNEPFAYDMNKGGELSWKDQLLEADDLYDTLVPQLSINDDVITTLQNTAGNSYSTCVEEQEVMQPVSSSWATSATFNDHLVADGEEDDLYDYPPCLQFSDDLYGTLVPQLSINEDVITTGQNITDNGCSKRVAEQEVVQPASSPWATRDDALVTDGEDDDLYDYPPCSQFSASDFDLSALNDQKGPECKRGDEHNEGCSDDDDVDELYDYPAALVSESDFDFSAAPYTNYVGPGPDLKRSDERTSNCSKEDKDTELYDYPAVLVSLLSYNIDRSAGDVRESDVDFDEPACTRRTPECS